MKKIAAIHDLSGYGRASLTVAIPILTHMGFQVCPLPTAYPPIANTRISARWI